MHDNMCITGAFYRLLHVKWPLISTINNHHHLHAFIVSTIRNTLSTLIDLKSVLESEMYLY